MKLNIKQLDINDRPREKMLEKGPAALTSAELLAILIGSGSTDETAVGLMQRVMSDCGGSLAALERMDIAELCAYKGLGPAKAVTIQAACELGKRRMSERALSSEQFTSASVIARYYTGKLMGQPVEECHVLLLNHNLRFLASRLLSRGGITGTVVDVRRLLKEALLAGATHIALCHNHPSGSLRPSREDDALTRKVRQAAALMDITLIDHIIVAEGGYYSYQEDGRLE